MPVPGASPRRSRAAAQPQQGSLWSVRGSPRTCFRAFSLRSRSQPLIDPAKNGSGIIALQNRRSEPEHEFGTPIDRAALGLRDRLDRVREQANAIHIHLEIEYSKPCTHGESELTWSCGRPSVLGDLDKRVVPRVDARQLGIRLGDPKWLRGHPVHSKHERGAGTETLSSDGRGLDPRQREAFGESVPN